MGAAKSPTYFPDQGEDKGAGSAIADAVENAGSVMAGKMRMTDEYLQSLDGKARLKLNELKIKGVNDKARTEFADYIATLYKSGRLLHAVAAADFYRVIFQDGTLPTAIANQAEAASEIVRKINQATDVVRFKASSSQLSSASAILREAFKLNPDHPALQGLERVTKLKVADYYAQLKKCKTLLRLGNLDALSQWLPRPKRWQRTLIRQRLWHLSTRCN